MANFYAYVKAIEWESNVDPIRLCGVAPDPNTLRANPSYHPSPVQYTSRASLELEDDREVDVTNRQTGQQFPCFIVRSV